MILKDRIVVKLWTRSLCWN